MTMRPARPFATRFGAALAGAVVGLGVLGGTALPANAATSAQFGGSTGNSPRAIALDSAGNVYVSSVVDNTVTRISADGTSTTQFGGTTGSSPYGIAVDSAGNVYTANYGDNTVTRISADGTTAQFGGTTGSGPWAIAIDAFDNVYTADANGGTVTRISADGTSTTQFGDTFYGAPRAIAIDAAGNVYTANYGSSTVTRISADGTSTTQFGGTTGSQPSGIAIDAAGNVYTANYGSFTVTRISADGTTTQFGGTTGSQPSGIAIDAAGTVYTANYGDNTVTRISADGTTTQFGDGTDLIFPQSIAVNAIGDVFAVNGARPTVARIVPDRGPLLFSTGGFPGATVGQATSLTVTVTNSSSEGYVIPSAITAAGTGVHVTGGTCATGTLISTGGSCTVELAWTPTAEGPLTGASLAIAYPGGTTAQDSLTLTGTATGIPGPLDFSAGQFPAATVGQSATLTVTVTNTGTSAATPSAITAAGSNVVVRAGGTCATGNPIAVASTCTVSLGWTPTAEGPLTGASLMIAYPGGTTAQDSLTLTGTATAPLTLLSVTAGTAPAPVGKRTTLVSSVTSNSAAIVVTTSCSLGGVRVSPQLAARYCGTTITKTTGAPRVRITAAPTCSKNLTITATIKATKPGHRTATWTRTWQVRATPAVTCRPAA